jgi:hypothetical protein
MMFAIRFRYSLRDERRTSLPDCDGLCLSLRCSMVAYFYAARVREVVRFDAVLFSCVFAREAILLLQLVCQLGCCAARLCGEGFAVLLLVLLVVVLHRSSAGALCWSGFLPPAGHGFLFRGAVVVCSFAGIRDAPRGASVAPVRGGTYFSLQRQRKVGKRKPLTPNRLTRFIWT